MCVRAPGRRGGGRGELLKMDYARDTLLLQHAASLSSMYCVCACIPEVFSLFLLSPGMFLFIVRLFHRFHPSGRGGRLLFFPFYFVSASHRRMGYLL